MLQVWESLSRYLVWNQKKKLHRISPNYIIDDGSMILLKAEMIL